ncbi:sulfotransferase [Pseudooceanicola sp. C21-150M6]|uniref:sulfotransferase n=1 Tax=Pseudooceanicola sp. C21-150M6 TaxID=3434355 RepID=UPI003D7F3EC2
MTPAKKDISALLDKATEEFNAGRISGCHGMIADLIDRPPKDPSLRSRVIYLQLGCALYYTGDLDAARAVNASLATRHWRPMRYRLSLRLRDYTTARRLRKDPQVTDRERADFRTTAGLHLLWANRYRRAFPLFAHRHEAILFPKVMPTRARHVFLTANMSEDVDTIVLEQGLGDVLFHLAHIKAEGRHETSCFIGLRRYGSLIKRYFPQARFLAHEDMTEKDGVPDVHLAADFVGRRYCATGDLRPGLCLDTPTRKAASLPVWGICWRGGSGQNRREERHIPLRIFLDSLPRTARFMALQFDITDEERAMLQADGRCFVPLSDVTGDPLNTIDMIRDLAGVISVDSANWHMAGLSGVPLLAIMNQTAHWFWGPEARAESAFDTAQTIRKEHFSADAVLPFVARTEAEWQARPQQMRMPALAIDRVPVPERPVFMVGLPRSATSMTMGLLHAHGLWLGQTVAGNAENPKGYFESRVLRDELVKPVLTALGVDPLGVRSLPDWEVLPPFPTLRILIGKALRREKYDFKMPWGFKDPKLTLLWPLFDAAFPQARWVIVRRDREKVLDSLCRTSFMARHSTSPEFWKPFCAAYDYRLDRLRRSGAQVFDVDSDRLAAGDTEQIETVIEASGLTFDPQIAAAAIRRDV